MVTVKKTVKNLYIKMANQTADDKIFYRFFHFAFKFTYF